eukprot:GHVT01080185.1.p1 GENE.GHVT01080185.1~~GHVT01080185.1.p1  ORF type:complete len:284 (-),score=-10.33 GHVT01080185.1:674-1525(-)
MMAIFSPSDKLGARTPSWRGIPLKYVALLLLVAQTVAVVISLRISRMQTDPSVKYINTTAVVMSEALKLVSSIGIVWYERSWNVKQTCSQLHKEVLCKPFETLQVGIPAFLYTIQNNLIFIALSNLSGPIYQVTYQLKILTTAVLSVLILQRRLTAQKWLSLFVLTCGVSLVQFPTFSEKKTVVQFGNSYIGLVAVFSACCTSGLAGVYFEKILKESSTSIWLRNIQLAIFGCFLGETLAMKNNYSVQQSYYRTLPSFSYLLLLRICNCLTQPGKFVYTTTLY